MIIKKPLTTAVLCLTLLYLGFTGCKKDEKKDTVVTNTTFRSYIKSKIDGNLVNAEYAPPNSGLVTGSFDNDPFWVKVSMERYVSQASPKGYDIFISDLDLDKVTFPITLREGSQYHLDFIYNSGISGSEGNFVINNLDSTLFSLTLTKWANDILEGTFEGQLRWGNDYDSTVTVTDGEFKMKLMRLN